MIPIPPVLAKLIATGAVLLLQSFAMAYNEQVKRAAKEATVQAENTLKQMDAKDALQILGLADNLSVPLQRSDDRATAKTNFTRLFKKAEELNNPYLQGKISCAYRVCVDPRWDHDSEGGGSSQQQS